MSDSPKMKSHRIDLKQEKQEKLANNERMRLLINKPGIKKEFLLAIVLMFWSQKKDKAEGKTIIN